jgi:hypothetical protein
MPAHGQPAAATPLHGAYPPARTSSNCCPAELTKNPVEGFSAGLVDDVNIFEWAVTIIGPPDTL